MADPVHRKIEYRTLTTGSSTDPLSCHRSAFEGPILGTINEKIESYCLVLFIVHNSTRSVCSCSHDSEIRSLFVRNKPKRSLFDGILPPYGSKGPRKGSLPLYDSLPQRRRSSRKSSQLRTCCRALSSWPSFLASVSRPICRVSWLLSAMVFFFV